MTTKLYIVAIACLIGGLSGGFLLCNFSMRSQLSAYTMQVQSMQLALNASETQVQIKQSEIQAKDSLIQSQDAQIQAQQALIQADEAQIQAKDAQITALTNLSNSQNALIQLLKARLGIP